MVNVPIFLIKELRDLTNIGITECKQALISTNGNIQLAIKYMRKNGLIKSIERSGKITKEGIIITQISQNKKYGIILEINCETDFVTKNNKFKQFSCHVADIALKNKIFNITKLQNYIEEERKILISILHENINVRRIAHLEGDIIGQYLHNNKIGAIISISGTNHNEQLLKYISMQIVANKPKYISVDYIPKNIIDDEKNIQMKIAIESGKSKKIANIITEGRINEFINEISLINQPFIMNTKKRIIDLLHENNIIINSFLRFEMGENN